MSEFRFQRCPERRGGLAVRRSRGDYVSTVVPRPPGGRRQCRRHRLSRAAVRDVSHLFRPGHIAPLRRISTILRLVHERFVAQKCWQRKPRRHGPRRAGHRHRDRARQEGQSGGQRATRGAGARQPIRPTCDSLAISQRAPRLRRGGHTDELPPDEPTRPRRRVPFPLHPKGGARQ